MKRILYFGYYLKNLDWKLFGRFMRYVQSSQKRSAIALLWDVVISSFRYNISLLEYFQFRFSELNHEERKAWAGTGFMYEFQLRMNPKAQRQVLEDKTQFYKQYQQFFLHPVADLNDLRSKPALSEALLNNEAGKVVFKTARGKCGSQVKIRSAAEFDLESLPIFMKKNCYDLAEAYIIQHPALMRLSPSAVNTIRIFSQLNSNNEVEFLGCRLRISVNSEVDNMAAGNMAAPIDETSGIVTGPGVYSDITKPEQAVHPITGVPIVGFKVPFWQETLELVRKAAKAHPQNRSIGWDIVMTEKGPGLIEGNHDWCKLLWQLPVKKGLKKELESYL